MACPRTGRVSSKRRVVVAGSLLLVEVAVGCAPTRAGDDDGARGGAPSAGGGGAAKGGLGAAATRGGAGASSAGRGGTASAGSSAAAGTSGGGTATAGMGAHEGGSAGTDNGVGAGQPGAAGDPSDGAGGGAAGNGSDAGAAGESSQTVGGGSLSDPAEGPRPAHDYGDENQGYVLVKNWDFGKGGTIRSIADLNEHFQYFDQFGQIANGGGKYGAYTVAPDRAHAHDDAQPLEGVNTTRPVRELFADSVRTYLVGLDGALEVDPSNAKAGCGSFQAKWTLPAGGSRLGLDLIWETRVRYVTPPYFWFAIWTAGNQWNGGAEMDLIESFGYDNGGGNTNYDGRYWHSSVVGGVEETNYHSNWGAAMESYGVTVFDAAEYHTWTWVYGADDAFASYLDGVLVQRGFLDWTYGATPTGDLIDMSFIFDGAWGHTEIASVNHTLPVSELEGKYYEWDFSRVYLRSVE